MEKCPNQRNYRSYWTSSTTSKSPNGGGQVIFKGKNKEDGHYAQQYGHPDMDIDLEKATRNLA